MGRPRKPTHVLTLQGAFKKDPQRARPNEPKPAAQLGEPPKYFSDELVEIWHELDEMTVPGVLTVSDRWTVEVASQLMYQFRQSRTKESGQTMTGTELSQLNSCLSRMGLTPADRSKVGLSNDKEHSLDPFAELASELESDAHIQ
jgi:hypothetical protein